MRLSKIHIKLSKLALALCLMLATGQAWGANQVATVQTAGTNVKYKAGTGANCSDASGWTEGSTLTAALAAAGASSTLYVCQGTYSGAMVAASGGLDAGAANQTVQASGAVTIDFSAIDDHGVKDSSFYGGLAIKGYSQSVPLVLIGRTASVQPVFRVYNGTIQDAEIRGGTRGLQSLVNLTANRVTIREISGTDSAILIPGSDESVITLSYIKIIGCTSIGPEIYLTVSSVAPSTVTINNSVSYAGTGATLLMHAGSTAVVTLNNPIIVGKLISGTAHVIENQSSAGGTVTINNMLGHGNPYDADDYNFTNCTINNSILNKDPKFVSNRYPSAVALIVDDYTNLAWFNNTVKPKLDSRGLKGTFSLDSTNIVSAPNWIILNAIEDAGHEIACHTRRHFRLDDSIADAFTVLRAGETAGIALGVLATSTPHTYTLSSYTMSSLRAQMITDGYTVSALTALYDTLPSTCLKDFASGTSINGAYGLQLDATRTYAEEILASKQDMIAAGLNATSFVAPGGYTSETLRTYLQATAGFIGARGSGTSDKTLASFSIYNIGDRNLDTYIGDYDACVGSGETQANCIKRNTVAWLGKLGAAGELFTFYTHGESEWDSDEWDAFLDAIVQSGVQVKTLTELANFAKTYDPSGDLTTADNTIYTRTMVDGSNFRLAAGSPAIDAGTPVFTAAQWLANGDFVGNHYVYGAGPDIGTFEKKKFIFDEDDMLPKKCKTTNAACYVQP
jgi:hypothetical protein